MTPTSATTTTSSTSIIHDFSMSADIFERSYSEDEEKKALASLQTGNDDTMKHVYGFDDWESHKLSMLQKVTATRILDYEQIMANPSSPTAEELYTQITESDLKLGPRINLQSQLQSSSPSMALAAEFKRASPSKGDIAIGLSCGEQTAKYARAGAAMISVLTEYRWFKGGLDDLTNARIETQRVCEERGTGVRPAILRKEFVINTYQILEAAACGADTVLLIVAVTPSDLLKELIDFCRSIDMEPLVEVHAESELDVALDAGAKVIGVNNRNLHTFQVDLGTTDKAADELTKRGLVFDHNNKDVTKENEYVLCSLSGMSNAEDVHRYRTAGVGMVLIGESLMRAPDPEKAIRGLCLDPVDYQKSLDDGVGAGGAYTGGTKIVKVCGITNPEDALTACRSGASFIGLIFVEKSKRNVSISAAKSIVSAVRDFGERTNRIDLSYPENASASTKARALENAASKGRRPLVVGVFQNSNIDNVQYIAQDVGLDLVQLHGSEGMEACSHCSVPAIRVVHIEAGGDDEDDSAEKRAEKIMEQVTNDPVAILLDTAVKGVQGGTGVTFDWDVAKALQNQGLPVMVAGGLTAENVKDVVMDVKPWGVDVSSGVEGETAGKKDTSKVQAFVSGARKAAEEADKGF